MFKCTWSRSYLWTPCESESSGYSILLNCSTLKKKLEISSMCIIAVQRNTVSYRNWTKNLNSTCLFYVINMCIKRYFSFLYTFFSFWDTFILLAETKSRSMADAVLSLMLLGQPQLLNYNVSQFTVEIYCFADGRCFFKQPQSVVYHCNQYGEKISKKCESVRPSAHL